MRLIDVDELNARMYRKSFETDDGRQQWNGGLWIRYKIFEEARDETPTIEAEPVRRGRWIKMSDADGVFYGCSECGEWYKDTSDYCPNCGAKMGTLRDKTVRKETTDETD